MNCWEPLRADALQRSEQSQTRESEKPSDWAISSQADAKAPEGSTTRASRLKPTARQLYESGKTVRQIGQELNIPPRTITRWLNDDGVQMRKPGQTARTAQINSADWLRDQYVTQDKSAEKIAAETGVWPETVRRMLKKHGIAVRTTNKGREFDPEIFRKHAEWMRGRFTGENNPNWRGAKVSKYARERTSFASKLWSKQVRERDGKCVECGSTERLHAHHIKPWRKFPELRYSIENGVTLCALCHQDKHRHEFPEWVTRKAPRAQSTPQG